MVPESFLTTPSSATPPPATAPAGVPAGAQAGSPGVTPGAAAAAANPPSWRDTLPTELRGDPSLSKFNDMKDLASSYIHLQRMVGTDKIAVPTKNSSAEEWQGVFRKLGLPESVDKYELKTPEGFKGDQQFLSAFKEQAMKNGVLPQQAEKLLEWYHGVDAKAQETLASQKQAEQQKGIEGLRREWGEAWDAKVEAAKLAVDRFGGPEFRDYLNQSGAGNDPAIIKLMAKWGESLAEGQIRGEGDGRISGSTPAEAQARINQILSDMKHPYHNSAHADHMRSVEEMGTLFQAVYGKK